MKIHTKDISVARQSATRKETRSTGFFGSEIISGSLFSFPSQSFFCSTSKFTKKCTLHFLAQILCFFFFSRFCSSTSQRLQNDVFSSFFRPSKDAEGTSHKNIANKLLHGKVKKLRLKNPQLLPRPPTLQNSVSVPLEFLHR